MNSNFTNSNFGRILYVAIITLIVAATIFVIWYMTTGYRLGTYDPDTRLGSVYIGGLTEEEIEPKLTSKINTWYNDETIVFELQYQGYSYEFDRALFYFNIETSVDGILPGVVNNIQVYYQGDDLELVKSQIETLNFLENIIDNVDLTALIGDVLHDASLMKSFSVKNVEDYLIDPALNIEVLNTTTIYVPDGVDLTNIVTVVNDMYVDGKIIVTEKELFDMLETFADRLSDQEMSALSSAMLALILETNFMINEVHYQPTIDFKDYTVDNYPYFARNTHVAEVVSESFSFYNPNAIDYYFTINAEDNTMSLSGLPFEYNIVVEIEKTILPHIFVLELDGTQAQDGYEGAVIEVNRKIYDINNVKIQDKMILSEFYPPIREIGPVAPGDQE